MQPNARERHTRWEDSQIHRSWMDTRTGLEFLTALADRTLPNPPFFELLGFHVVNASEGEVVLEGVVGEHLYNAGGVVHGGYVATLIDTATALSVRSYQPAGARMTSVDLKLSFVRGLSADAGKVRCIGRTVHRGRKVSFAEATVTNAGDKLVATGSASLISL